VSTLERGIHTSIGCEGDDVVLTVSGSVDLDSAPALRAGLAALDDMRSNVVVDLTDVHFVDSAGINLLAWARNRFAEQGRGLVLRGVRSRTAEVLALGGLDQSR
jgi:anti-anti-sigma factor